MWGINLFTIMKLTKTFFSYVSIIIILLLILKITGFIGLLYSEIISSVLMLSGLGVVYFSFGTNRRLLLFVGTQLFLGGILITLNDKFLLEDISTLFLSALSTAIGFGFLFLFLNEHNRKIYFLISAFFLITGLLMTALHGTIDFTEIIPIFIEVVAVYWLLIILTGLALIIYLFVNKRS